MNIAVDISAVTCGDIDFSEIEKLGNVEYFKDISVENMFSVCKNADAVIVNKVCVDENFLNNCPKLKYVGIFATGYNLIDLKECAKRGITVCNVPDYSTNSVAQHTFALLLSLVGKISEYSSSVAAGDWIKSKTFTYMTWRTSALYGKTFGVYGYGNIGKAVAKIADAFGMNVLVHSRTKPENCPYKVVSSKDIFAYSDILSFHCPLTPETEKIVNAETLATMKRGAVIINTARGGLIDENALAFALENNLIAGAGLDVVATEPMDKNTPLLGVKNLIITPHIAWIPRETRQSVVNSAAQNLACFIAGKPINKVN